MSVKRINRKSNSTLVKTIVELKEASRKNEAPLWRSIANRLEGSSRNWPSVNVSKLEYNVNKNGKAIVPGKLMGTGIVTKKMTVAAYSFTDSAKEKIQSAGGKCLTYNEMIKATPKGTDVMVIG
ncbi:MAG: 50S ribosomal protein L18e [Candidatus Thermoplasmatota archaeon]|nr:50S ribosomal protein L18e [Candidatus Thermoplasmatota archaeon]